MHLHADTCNPRLSSLKKAARHEALISSITWPAFYIYFEKFLWEQILHTLQTDRQCGGIMQKCG